MKRLQRGFTILELMVVTIIVALIFAIAVPSFRDLALGSHLSSTAHTLLASVQYARSEAIKRNTTVTLCASSDQTTCAAGGGWEQGWIVRDATGTVLQVQGADDAGYVVDQAGGTVALSFLPIGLGSSPATFTVCRDDPLGRQERVLTLRASGMGYVTTTETGSCP